ncbi:MAG: nucleotidyltransferase family protein [Chloroflexi bacterium]|nr:nucleotidyltransferase family protein [Chloroflexota bacterium]
MKNLNEIRLVIKSLGEEVRKEYKAEILSVFGSYARGEQEQTSDIDVLVKFHSGATLLDMVGLADLLEDKLGARVDVVPVETLRKEIKDAVISEAIPI